MLLASLYIPTLDNLRNFFLTTTTEVLSSPTVARNALKLPVTPSREHWREAPKSATCNRCRPTVDNLRNANERLISFFQQLCDDHPVAFYQNATILSLAFFTEG